MENSMGKMIVITAPSGAGKTTIVKHLLKKFDWLAFSVSATTRLPRIGEVHGKDYYFLSTEEFRKRIEEGAFAEWEEVYPGKYYGTLKKEIERIWNENKYVIFDIEVKGATNIKKNYGENALVVFVKPPSIKELLCRLENRKSENSYTLKERLARAKEEMTYENNFDEILVNDQLELTLIEAEDMVRNFITLPPNMLLDIH